ncbi:MAG: hypothetical protein CMD72_04575 [Gammaproteobacteria bacterium]|jgi:tetratricopeptide (TPR) repeat protein|nr:hypothetical protein [Gammaproteobacteria bacterium]|tara:strand:+ start:1534 stop:2670 length:1137 start_codon:yes stop_codon:yes gene_type:complete
MKQKIKRLMDAALESYNQGNLIDAEEVFEKVYEIDKSQYQAIFNIGVIKFLNKDFKKAEKFLKEAFELNKSDKYFSSIVDVLLSQNKIKESKSFIKNYKKNISIELVSASKEKIKHQILTNEIVNDYNSREEYNISENLNLIHRLEKFIDKYPNNFIALKILGTLLFEKESNSSEENKTFNKTIKLYEKSYSINNKDVNLVLKLGSLYTETLNYKKAIGLYSQGKRSFPDNNLLFFNMGNTYIKMYELKKGIEEYLKSIKIDTSHFDSYKNLAKAYKDLNEINLANNTYKKMIELDPKDPSGYRGLGAVNVLESNFSDGEKLLKKSLELDPNNEDALQNLTICYFHSGKTQKGIISSTKNVGAISFSKNKELGNYIVI